MTSVIIWLIWWLFDYYLIIIALLWLFVTLKYYITMFMLQKCERERNNCFIIRQGMLPHNNTITVDRPARSVKIVSDLLVSSLQSAPHSLQRGTHHTQLSPWFSSHARESGWSWTGERGIQYVIKCSRASWLARARTLASALVSSRELR